MDVQDDCIGYPGGYAVLDSVGARVFVGSQRCVLNNNESYLIAPTEQSNYQTLIVGAPEVFALKDPVLKVISSQRSKMQLRDFENKMS